MCHIIQAGVHLRGGIFPLLPLAPLKVNVHNDFMPPRNAYVFSPRMYVHNITFPLYKTVKL